VFPCDKARFAAGLVQLIADSFTDKHSPYYRMPGKKDGKKPKGGSSSKQSGTMGGVSQTVTLRSAPVRQSANYNPRSVVQRVGKAAPADTGEPGERFAFALEWFNAQTGTTGGSGGATLGYLIPTSSTTSTYGIILDAFAIGGRTLVESSLFQKAIFRSVTADFVASAGTGVAGAAVMAIAEDPLISATSLSTPVSSKDVGEFAFAAEIPLNLTSLNCLRYTNKRSRLPYFIVDDASSTVDTRLTAQLAFFFVGNGTAASSTYGKVRLRGVIDFYAPHTVTTPISLRLPVDIEDLGQFFAVERKNKLPFDEIIKRLNPHLWKWIAQRSGIQTFIPGEEIERRKRINASHAMRRFGEYNGLMPRDIPAPPAAVDQVNIVAAFGNNNTVPISGTVNATVTGTVNSTITGVNAGISNNLPIKIADVTATAALPITAAAALPITYSTSGVFSTSQPIPSYATDSAGNALRTVSDSNGIVPVIITAGMKNTVTTSSPVVVLDTSTVDGISAGGGYVKGAKLTNLAVYTGTSSQLDPAIISVNGTAAQSAPFSIAAGQLNGTRYNPSNNTETYMQQVNGDGANEVVGTVAVTGTIPISGSIAMTGTEGGGMTASSLFTNGVYAGTSSSSGSISVDVDGKADVRIDKFSKRLALDLKDAIPVSNACTKCKIAPIVKNAIGFKKFLCVKCGSDDNTLGDYVVVTQSPVKSAQSIGSKDSKDKK